MPLLKLKKKIAPLFPKGKNNVERFMKDALLLQLQETNKKIAIFEARYDKSCNEFVREWKKKKNDERYSYEQESDYLDWEALEDYKRDLMRVIHSL